MKNTGKYKNKYRTTTARTQWWDYGWNGAYFITICTQNRAHYFGEVCNGVMELSQQGVIADILWHEIPNHAPYVELGNYIVMPNHIHGILILDKPDNVVECGDGDFNGNPHPHPKTGGFAGNKNPMIHENVSRIIRWYKGRCSFDIRKIHADFAWQSRFHDHIIRNDAEYQRISDYIVNNPTNWCNDKFYIQ